MIYNKLIENIFLPIGDLINNSSYKKQLKYWREIDLSSENELYNLQIKNLKKILYHAKNNTTQYKSISLIGNDPEKWLKDFPILQKKDLKKSNNFISIKSNKNKLIPYSSSGSSGVQSTVYMNKKEQSNIRAILTHWWEWSGYKIGNPLIQTGITPNRSNLKKIKDFLFKTIYIDAFSHSESQLKKICSVLQENKNLYFIAGYASSLNVIAEYALNNNYSLKVKSVISFGDKLFNHYKKNINKAFTCNVYDTYGCNEGFLIASQKDLDYKYIMTPHVYLEILDDKNNPVKDGEIGNIVVTRLDSFSMPLIRYKIGDLGIKLPREKYPKVREFNYPLLQQIVGRETDIIITKNGKKLVVHSFTGIFEYIKEIKQFKVIQEDRNGIIIEYIKAAKFNKDVLIKATKELQKYINDNSFSIIYKEVTFIANSKSGKPQIIESKLEKK